METQITFSLSEVKAKSWTEYYIRIISSYPNSDFFVENAFPFVRGESSEISQRVPTHYSLDALKLKVFDELFDNLFTDDQLRKLRSSMEGETINKSSYRAIYEKVKYLLDCRITKT